MLRWCGRDRDLVADRMHAMPWDLSDIAKALFRKPMRMTLWRDQRRIRADLPQRLNIQMIIMRMSEQHRIDLWKVGDAAGRRCFASKLGQGKGRAVVGKNRIDQQRDCP